MSLTRSELQSLGWRKARRSIGNGDCVEIATVDEQVAVRDSKDPAGAILRYDANTWLSFLSDTKRGDCDRFL
jgi:hypothetical protein